MFRNVLINNLRVPSGLLWVGGLPDGAFAASSAHMSRESFEGDFHMKLPGFVFNYAWISKVGDIR